MSTLVIDLEDDEYITDLGVKYGWYMDRVEFTTNKGRVHGAGGSGSCWSSGVAQDGKDNAIIGFEGTYDHFLNQI